MARGAQHPARRASLRGAGQGTPAPRAPNSSAQITSAALLPLSPTLPSSTAEAQWPRTERMEQQVRGFRATVATSPAASAVPLPGMLRFATAGAPRSRLPDVVSHLGFATCSAKPRSTHVLLCPRGYRRAFSQLHFQSGSHMFGLCGERGPAAQLRRSNTHLLLFTSFSLTLELCQGTPSPH